jgi:ATP-binding cassette subfamily B protein
VDLSGVSVLVVDDNRGVREVLAMILADCGAAVREAESADEAILACDERTPDVIVSDLMMPYRDGYAFLRTLRTRAACSGVPVIAVSGHFHDRERARAAGFIEFLAKPVDSQLLCERVGHHVAASRTRGRS